MRMTSRAACSTMRVLPMNSHLPQTAHYLKAQTVLVTDVIERYSETMRTLSLAVESMVGYGPMINPTTSKRFIKETGNRKVRADAIVALGKPAILYADDVVLSRDARSAVPLLLLSSATEFSGFVRDDLRPASSAARAYAVKYGSALCRWSSTEAVAEALGGSAPVWLGLIDYGGTDSQTAIPGLGSFHGLPLALFSSESSYSACADLSSAGAQALSAQLKQALAGFMTSGSPGWDVWTPQDRDALHFDADSETACITFNSYPDTQESIRAAMAADTSLSAAEKETVEHLYFSGFSF